MKRFFQHILALFFVAAAWMTIYMLLTTNTGGSQQYNHESFFFTPGTEVTDMGGRSTAVKPETLFPSAPLIELGPEGPPLPEGMEKEPR